MQCVPLYVGLAVPCGLTVSAVVCWAVRLRHGLAANLDTSRTFGIVGIPFAPLRAAPEDAVPGAVVPPVGLGVPPSDCVQPAAVSTARQASVAVIPVFPLSTFLLFRSERAAVGLGRAALQSLAGVLVV